MWRLHTLFRAWEKYTNGMKMGSVILACRYNDIGMNQISAGTEVASIATRIIIRTVAPGPAKSLATQEREWVVG